MAASYNLTRGLPLDRARELLGDAAVEPYTEYIPDADALHSDEHILAVLAREGEAMGVSWLAAELVARYAQDPVRISSQGDSFDLSNLLKQWEKLAAPALARATAAATLAAAGSTPARVATIGRLTTGLLNPLR